MTRLIVFLGGLLSSTPALLGGANVLAFERDNAVWIAKIDGAEEGKSPRALRRHCRRTESGSPLTRNKPAVSPRIARLLSLISRPGK